MVRILSRGSPTFLSVLLLLCSGSAFAHSSSNTTPVDSAGTESTTVRSFDVGSALHAKGVWTAVVYNDPVHQYPYPFPMSKSRICFQEGSPAAPECHYFARLFDRGAGDEHFVSLSVVHLAPHIEGIKLDAAADYVDGHASQAAIWVYRADSDALTLALKMAFGNESNGHLIQEGPLNGDYIGVRKWGSGDKTRWDPQKYRIEVYRYDPATYKYVAVLSYVTSADYYPESDSPDLYKREMPNIESRLKRP
jgi:hypothetical protein